MSDPAASHSSLPKTSKGELKAYNANRFDPSMLDPGTRFPLPDEPFVACWRAWVTEAEQRGAFATLASYLPQLRFPVRHGISESTSYRRATRQGLPTDEMAEASGLVLDEPASVELEVYPSLAGGLPLIKVYGRQQFASLVRALSKRNEPVPVPPSMGAQMVAGFNNWHRLHQLRDQWLETPEDQRERPTWNQEFAHIRNDKWKYQDRFMLLSDGPYSAVPASELGLDDAEWRDKSLIIRRDHECAHYFTRRVFGAMRNNLLDELIADYAGIVAAEGRYRSQWFLHFMGLEDFPRYRAGGRLENYRGDPPLGESAFEALHEQVVRAADTLETFDRQEPSGERTLQRQALILASLAVQRLDELAGPRGVERLRTSMADMEEKLARAPASP